MLGSRAYRAVYPQRLLTDHLDRISCPMNDRLCEEAVWLTQTMLLGTRRDMGEIAEAVRKISAHAHRLVKV